MLIHSNFQVDGDKRDLLNVIFVMLRTCKTEITHAGETSS